LRYLGYRLKPLGYKIADWKWPISKVDKQLNIWYHKYLSRAGRLVLIKAVIEATPVYWMTLVWIPRGILSHLQNLCCKFLWKGNQPGRIFAWTSWESLALPKSWGGWGINRLDTFSQALAAKLGWQLLNNNSLWTKVIVSKYIHPASVQDWIRQDTKRNNISIIWKVVINTKELIHSGLIWRIRSRTRIQIGIDPWVGRGNTHTLTEGLIGHLQANGIVHINQIADEAHTTIFQQAWRTTNDLNIPRCWQQE